MFKSGCAQNVPTKGSFQSKSSSVISAQPNGSGVARSGMVSCRMFRSDENNSLIGRISKNLSRNTNIKTDHITNKEEKLWIK